MDYEKARALVEPSEGFERAMYLDTKGLVTVGIGCLLAKVADACALPFVRRGTTAAATKDEIAVAYNRVSVAPKGLIAKSYRNLTNIELPDEEVLGLFRRKVDEFSAQLEAVYPGFSTFPDPAQAAIFDLAYSMGTHKLLTEWPNLNGAIARGDWTTAADHCHRAGAQESRNALTRDLFLAAAVA